MTPKLESTQPRDEGLKPAKGALGDAPTAHLGTHQRRHLAPTAGIVRFIAQCPGQSLVTGNCWLIDNTTDGRDSPVQRPINAASVRFLRADARSPETEFS